MTAMYFAKRETLFGAQTRFWVDTFHYSGHIQCAESLNPAVHHSYDLALRDGRGAMSPANIGQRSE